jgi:hypothetical protein
MKDRSVHTATSRQRLQDTATRIQGCSAGAAVWRIRWRLHGGYCCSVLIFEDTMSWSSVGGCREFDEQEEYGWRAFDGGAGV